MIQIEVVRLKGWPEICRITEIRLPGVSNPLLGMRSRLSGICTGMVDYKTSFVQLRVARMMNSLQNYLLHKVIG